MAKDLESYINQHNSAQEKLSNYELKAEGNPHKNAITVE